MLPSLLPLPDFVIPAALITWALVSAHIQLIQQKRLSGYSIITHFIATASLACVAFISFYMPSHWHGGAQSILIVGCFVVTAACMSVTKKLPALPTQKRWRKPSKRKSVKQMG